MVVSHQGRQMGMGSVHWDTWLAGSTLWDPGWASVCPLRCMISLKCGCEGALYA
jgi:hypothetical protein